MDSREHIREVKQTLHDAGLLPKELSLGFAPKEKTARLPARKLFGFEPDMDFWRVGKNPAEPDQIHEVLVASGKHGWVLVSRLPSKGDPQVRGLLPRVGDRGVYRIEAFHNDGGDEILLIDAYSWQIAVAFAGYAISYCNRVDPFA